MSAFLTPPFCLPAARYTITRREGGIEKRRRRMPNIERVGAKLIEKNGSPVSGTKAKAMY
jgi:hypothetical protein